MPQQQPPIGPRYPGSRVPNNKPMIPAKEVNTVDPRCVCTPLAGARTAADPIQFQVDREPTYAGPPEFEARRALQPFIGRSTQAKSNGFSGSQVELSAREVSSESPLVYFDIPEPAAGCKPLDGVIHLDYTFKDSPDPAKKVIFVLDIYLWRNCPPEFVWRRREETTPEHKKKRKRAPWDKGKGKGKVPGGTAGWTAWPDSSRVVDYLGIEIPWVGDGFVWYPQCTELTAAQLVKNTWSVTLCPGADKSLTEENKKDVSGYFGNGFEAKHNGEWIVDVPRGKPVYDPSAGVQSLTDPANGDVIGKAFVDMPGFQFSDWKNMFAKEPYRTFQFQSATQTCEYFTWLCCNKRPLDPVYRKVVRTLTFEKCEGAIPGNLVSVGSKYTSEPAPANLADAKAAWEGLKDRKGLKQTVKDWC